MSPAAHTVVPLADFPGEPLDSELQSRARQVGDTPAHLRSASRRPWRGVAIPRHAREVGVSTYSPSPSLAFTSRGGPLNAGSATFPT